MTRASLRAACTGNPEQAHSMGQLLGLAEDHELERAGDVALWRDLAHRWLDAAPGRHRSVAKAHMLRVLHALRLNPRRVK